MKFRLASTRRLELLFLFILGLVVNGTAASEGDADEVYQECRRLRTQELCAKDKWQRGVLDVLSGWDCAAQGQYECMWESTKRRVAQGTEIVQFHGKWPFVRMGGIQEPASVLFSLGNLWVHWNGLRSVLSAMSQGHGLSWMRSWYVIYGIASLNAWLWSSVFHTRDSGWTEKMDYFSAAFAVLTGSVVALIRTFRPRNTRILAMVSFLIYCAHVAYLSLWRFDYSYNMAANVLIGLAHNLIWLFWAVTHPERPYRRTIVVAVILVSLSMGLELLDFPPWAWILDAHALWHASTIFIIPMFYKFTVQDIQWESSKLLGARKIRGD